MSRTVTFVTGGGMRQDFIITRQGQAYNGQIGGNALYAAVGAALWHPNVGLWARLGQNYPRSWLAELEQHGLDTAGVRQVPGEQEHRTFYAYTADGRREDSHAERHYARIGQAMPASLRGYQHSTPGQDDPERYEPLALRPEDWPPAYGQAVAVHLSPLSIKTHREVPAFLRARFPRLQITIDPGERYMVPALASHLRRFLPLIDAFLPSEQEVRSLFGADLPLLQAARQLGAWGVPLVVVKQGEKGALLYRREEERFWQMPAFHPPGSSAVIDVTGAGDAFCGGFMVGLAQLGDPVQAVRQGLASASLVVEGYGALYALGRGAEEAARRLRNLPGPGSPA